MPALVHRRWLVQWNCQITDSVFMRRLFCLIAPDGGSLPATPPRRSPASRSSRAVSSRSLSQRRSATARGRLVKDLKSSDFELFDDGQKRTLTNVWSEPSPASVAILMDASGSMATKMARARETANALVAGLKPGADEVALYSFDTALKEVRPFSSAFSATDDGVERDEGVRRDIAVGCHRGNRAENFGPAAAASARRHHRRRRLGEHAEAVGRLGDRELARRAGLHARDSIRARRRPMCGRHRSCGPMADLAAWTGGDSLAVRDPLSMLAGHGTGF